jgi:hypothetical protein
MIYSLLQTLNKHVVRERPFNLKGGGMVLFQKNILIPNVAEKNILILVEEKKIILKGPTI